MKLFICLFFSFLIFIASPSHSQNNPAASIKKPSKDTSSEYQKARSDSKPNSTLKLTSDKTERTSRPFYMNTVLSSKDSIAENRVIKIVGDQLSNEGFSLEIKNRWGNAVYESHSLNQMTTTGWDGKKNEVLYPPGIYSFVVHYQNTDGDKFKKSGFITIQ